MFWQAAFIGSHPEVLTMVAGHTPPEVKVLKAKVISTAFFWVISASVLGNFASGWAARGRRRNGARPRPTHAR
jgi:hypothetical protein